jgi:hypothetical protein
VGRRSKYPEEFRQCTAAARSGRRYRFVVMRLVLSWRPVARAHPGQGDGGIAARSSVHQLQASPPDLSPCHGSGRRAALWPW